MNKSIFSFFFFGLIGCWFAFRIPINITFNYIVSSILILFIAGILLKHLKDPSLHWKNKILELIISGYILFDVGKEIFLGEFSMMTHVFNWGLAFSGLGVLIAILIFGFPEINDSKDVS